MSEEKASRDAKDSIINFLKANVRPSDAPKIEEELKQTFVLAKKKSKVKKRRFKKKTRFLTRNEKKELGFYNIPRNSLKYRDMVHMHDMWKEYMSQVLDGADKKPPQVCSKHWDSFVQSLYKADFHGSILEVVRSKCPSYIGKIGICIMDTKNTFKILSENDKVTTIPKKDCVFDMHLGDLRIMLFGKHLCVRPAERSTKKVKMQSLPDLS